MKSLELLGAFASLDLEMKIHQSCVRGDDWLMFRDVRNGSGRSGRHKQKEGAPSQTRRRRAQA